MPVTFREAIRSGTQLLLGLAGPSGSGKTLSALYIADGIRQVIGGEIFGIDTENGRMSHYADELLPYRFQVGQLGAPFSPQAYLDAIRAAKAAGAKVIIVDSASHMHEGPGGVIAMHDAELTRMAGSDYGKRDKVKFSAWIEPKRQVNLFVTAVLQIDVHFIFAFRAKDKLVMVKNRDGKNEPVSAGWTPIITERFDYEMTATLLLPPGAQGVPDLEHSPKMTKNLLPLFRAGQALDRETGRRLAEWAEGRDAGAGPRTGAEGGRSQEASLAPSADPPIDTVALRQVGQKAAAMGMATLREWWDGLPKPAKAAMKDAMVKLKVTADEADERKSRAA